MSKAEIRSWITASETADNDEQEIPTFQWSDLHEESRWPAFLEYTKGQILTSSTRRRIEFLEERLTPLVSRGDLKTDQLGDIFILLTLTYPRYIDIGSREAAEGVLRSLVLRSDEGSSQNDSKIMHDIIKWLSVETSQVAKRGLSSTAPANQFVLLGWTCTVYSAVSQFTNLGESQELLKALLTSFGVLLDSLLNREAPVKQSLCRGAVVRIRRAFRSTPGLLQTLISTEINLAKVNATPLVFILLLGLTLDVVLHLKDKKDQARMVNLDVIHPLKGAILESYLTLVIMSKVPVAPHISSAFEGFIGTFIAEEDLNNSVIPIVEKSLLRSPEIATHTIKDFFNAYNGRINKNAFSVMLKSVLNGVKSTNASVRKQSCELFSVLTSHHGIGDVGLTSTVTELLALPKAGKTSGAEHRIALYEMLSSVKPGPGVSSKVSEELPTLIAKETNDAALSILAKALGLHITWRLLHNEMLESSIVNTVVKEVSSNKPALRRAFCIVTGNALWNVGNHSTDASQSFASAALPALENNLKTVFVNPLTSTVGPLEGYVAFATLLGPMTSLKLQNYDTTISKNAVIQAISASTASKPHFILWQKCYQKLTTQEEEEWLLRSLEVGVSHFKSEIHNSEILRLQFGAAFVHLCAESKHVEIRRATLEALQSITSRFPMIANWMIRDALINRISMNQDMSGDNASAFLQGRFNAVLSTSAALSDDMELKLREDELVKNIILAHHPTICGSSRSSWIELCQRARVDPYRLISRNSAEIIELVLDNISVTKQGSTFFLAAFDAVQTLVFVAPSIVLPRLVEQIRIDLDPTSLTSIGNDEYGVWKTPKGTLFVDVLSKKANVSIAKGKESELRKWEAELRKSLATKKAADVMNLSKQDRALVDAQLAKESEIRSKVNLIKASVERGLQIIRTIVKTGAPEFHAYIPSVTALLLSGVIRHQVPLFSDAAFETYVVLSDVCSIRLGTFRKWIGICTLRCLESDAVPTDLTIEPIGQLILRVLYRLRSLAEQAPFDSATYCYVSPLINGIVSSGWKNVANADEALEQLTLVLDFIRFHCNQFSDISYPRQDTINNLISLLRTHPQLSQTCVPSLVDLGEAIHRSATTKDTQFLIAGTLNQELLVRNACLQALQVFDLTDLDWSPEIWLACHDDDEQNSRLSQHIWEENGLDVPESYLIDLLPFLEHSHSYVRLSCAYALAEAAEAWPQLVANVLLSLQQFYLDKAKILAPELDEYGMVIAQTLDRSDPWPARLAIARTFEALASLFPDESIIPFFKFLVSQEGLGDRQAEVRRGLLSAGTAVLDAHGPSHLTSLISMFQENLTAASKSETEDYIQEAVVILFGRLAKHLQSDDPRIPEVIDRLVTALKTPAESVQVAVSDCLAPLVKTTKINTTILVDKLFTELFTAPKYAARRGAAYGLAGIIKGAGISGMKQFNVLGRLRSALEDKKNMEARQGALFAFETLSLTLGRIFEPYVPHLVPYLLTSFGDTITDVREATQDAARVIMGNMSAYGVKLLLPSLLSGLDEKQWRTKKGSIELLGTMAFCSPTQLSISLPTVIPRLTGVLADSHAQVRTAANKSLKQFGEVINNPEIQALVPVLLKALSDPDKGPSALAALLKTSFAHYIDPSSLALVIPIIERGLRERSSETKRKAARIVGNMSSLTDPKDFVPYLSRLLPLVHICLVDPVPEARATAAKALGTLVERLGEVHFPDLVPGLLRTLKSETSGVDRQGAAQGLSEVLAGLGMERLEGLLPDIITSASSPRSHVKEGFMSLLVFLPATFGVRFTPHLPKLIQPILGGLADSEEVVREAALKAGKVIINNHSHRAVDLLLPELERGLFDSSSRIRQSSVTLISDLLFKLAGISGKNEIEHDEAMAENNTVDNSRRLLADALGDERKDRVLASIYLVRQDGVATVRMSATHVWKALVQNTPRTVREILPSIMVGILFLLVNPGPDQQETAKRTLAELCRKSGDKLFSELVTLLDSSITSNDDTTREGACLALSEVLEQSSEGQREGHEEKFIAMVRHTLVDRAANVRSAAAKAFQFLQEAFGARAIDETIPILLAALRHPGENSDTALQALKEVMNVRATVVFPILIPTLLTKPITSFNARALASLVTVAGDALNKRLTNILEGLVSSLEIEPEGELRDDINDAIRALLASVPDDTGLNALMLLLLGWAKHHAAARRTSALTLFGIFCEETDLDMTNYRDNWISHLVTSLDDQIDVARAAWKSLNDFAKTISPADMEALVVPLRSAIESIGAPGRAVPGFNLPDGVGPLVPIILAGLATGTSEQRESAAHAIGDIIEKTDESAIKPFVVRLTGPLIRAHSAGYPPNVKTAIVTALTVMLRKIPLLVKPFFPQLQRTFVKATSDPSSFAVRSQGAVGLGTLMAVQPRVDPLVTELITSAKASEEAVAASLVLALAYVAKNASANLGEGSKTSAAELISNAFRESHDEYYVQAIALLFANLAPFPELLRPIVVTYLIAADPSVLTSHVIRTTIEESSELFYALGCVPAIVQKINQSIGGNPSISRPAREAKELMKIAQLYADDTL